MLKDVVVVLVLLLILAGDVELNPGPGKCELPTIITMCAGYEDNSNSLLITYSEGQDKRDSIS